MADGLGTTRDSQGYSDCQRYSDMGSPWLTVSGQPGTVRVTVTVRGKLYGCIHVSAQDSHSNCDKHGGLLTVRACTRHPSGSRLGLSVMTGAHGKWKLSNQDCFPRRWSRDQNERISESNFNHTAHSETDLNYLGPTSLHYTNVWGSLRLSTNRRMRRLGMTLS